MFIAKPSTRSRAGIALLLGAMLTLLLASCEKKISDEDQAALDAQTKAAEQKRSFKNPYPSTYKPKKHAKVFIEDATVLDGLGRILKNGDVRIEDGKIVEVGTELHAAPAEVVINGKDRWVTPGIIDVHSHLGARPQPNVTSHKNLNERTQPVTAEVWVEHSVSSKDPGYLRARAGGVTTLQILPGSANLFGGRSVVLKNVPSRTMQGMKFPDAPYGLKMACGENPKRVYGPKGGPYTTMGNVAGYRAAWIKADDYRKKWAAFEGGEADKAPKRDLELETLAGVLDGDILVHMHCYLADEMAVMIDLMKEFDYQIASFQHAVEAYKIRDMLAENNICAAMWADWWGFKMESYDGIRENVPFVHEAGGCAIVHSDSEVGIQRLNQEAAKALADGRRAGVQVTKGEAWTWLSANPARSLGIFHKTGSIEVGKDADVVIWTGDPFSTYTKAERVYIDGVLQYDLYDPDTQPLSDFELGQNETGEVR
jgi:imidazolonepropionase-like amidohydrolase